MERGGDDPLRKEREKGSPQFAREKEREREERRETLNCRKKLEVGLLCYGVSV